MAGKSTSTSKSETNQTDNRRVIGEGGISAESSTVNVLDNGAIAKSFEFASGISAGALQLANSAQGAIKDSYADAKGRGALTDYLLLAAIAGACLIALAAVRGKR